MFKSIAGLFVTHIPHKGGAPVTSDLIGGQVDMMFEQMYAVAPSIRAGKLRALAITSTARRWPTRPFASRCWVRAMRSAAARPSSSRR